MFLCHALIGSASWCPALFILENVLGLRRNGNDKSVRVEADRVDDQEGDAGGCEEL